MGDEETDTAIEGMIGAFTLFGGIVVGLAGPTIPGVILGFAGLAALVLAYDRERGFLGLDHNVRGRLVGILGGLGTAGLAWSGWKVGIDGFVETDGFGLPVRTTYPVMGLLLAGAALLSGLASLGMLIGGEDPPLEDTPEQRQTFERQLRDQVDQGSGEGPR